MKTPVLVKENPMKKKKEKKKEPLACQWETLFLFKIMENAFPPIVRQLGIRCEFTQQTTANVCVFWIN